MNRESSSVNREFLRSSKFSQVENSQSAISQFSSFAYQVSVEPTRTARAGGNSAGVQYIL
jgi:hypothetical protein